MCDIDGRTSLGLVVLINGISVCIGHVLCVVRYFDVSRLQEEQGLFRNNDSFPGW
jgi:hypothetical protein